MPPDQEPTAAVTSRTAVIAALLMLGAIIVMVIVTQTGGSDDGKTDPDASAAARTGLVTTGTTAPEITLTSLDGDVVSLSDYAGRPVLINIWASWCPPCRDEFPALAEAREAYADGGLEILGITHNDGEAQTRRFVTDAGAEWPILPDTADVVWNTYGAVGTPTSYFIDAEGVVQRVHIGPLNEEQLADHLSAIGLSGAATTGDAA